MQRAKTFYDKVTQERARKSDIGLRQERERERGDVKGGEWRRSKDEEGKSERRGEKGKDKS